MDHPRINKRTAISPFRNSLGLSEEEMRKHFTKVHLPESEIDNQIAPVRKNLFSPAIPKSSVPDPSERLPVVKSHLSYQPRR